MKLLQTVKMPYKFKCHWKRAANTITLQEDLFYSLLLNGFPPQEEVEVKTNSSVEPVKRHRET